MSSILYPVFVYIYIYMMMRDYVDEAKEFMNTYKDEFGVKNKSEISALESLEKDQLADDRVVQKYMNNKCMVSISPYSYKLLLHFVKLRVLVILLYLFNMHIDFNVTSDKMVLEQHSSTSLLLPYTAEELEKINKKSITWGRLLISPEAHALKVKT